MFFFWGGVFFVFLLGGGEGRDVFFFWQGGWWDSWMLGTAKAPLTLCEKTRPPGMGEAMREGTEERRAEGA